MSGDGRGWVKNDLNGLGIVRDGWRLAGMGEDAWG